MQDGVIYLPGGANVFAFDARTGERIWRWQPDEEDGRVPSWQGVALGDGLVFSGTRSAEVVALRQDTGELVWATPVGSQPRTRGETVTSAPMYARGKVFVGVANGDIGGQGRIVALDAATGEVAWTFFVVPRPGEFGHETWPQDNDSWTFGGGGVWLVGTVDPDLGMVYFSTGNPTPMFGGELREGDNLFTAAVVALDMETGERQWHYQVVRHDIWDADIATPLLLYDTTVDGEAVKAVAAMRADGYLFLLNRETGEPLLPIEERPVPQDAHQRTVPTQPFPVRTESILPECSYWRDRVPPPFQLNCSSYTPPSVDEQTVVAPEVPIPLVRVTPLAFSPQTGYIYAQGRAQVGRARRFRDPFVWNTARFHLTLPDPVGILAAVDTRTGRLAWKKEMPGAFLGTSGPLVTAGGLLFRGSPAGQVEAYDVRSGARRWAFRTSPEGARVRPGPASAHALDGAQHIVIPMGAGALVVHPRRRGAGARRAGARPAGGRAAARSRAAGDRRNRDRHAAREPAGRGRRAALRVRRAQLQPGTGARHRRHAGPVHQQRRDRAHRGGARRKLVHRHARAGHVGLRDARRAGDVPLPL